LLASATICLFLPKALLPAYIALSSYQPNLPIILNLKYPTDPDSLLKRKTPLYYCPQVSIFWGDVIKNLLLLQSTSPTPSNSILLKTDKASYSPGEPIKVNFSGFPGNKQDWISIAYPYYQPNQSLQWQYTQGRTQGTISFKGLPAGDYEVRAYLNWPEGKYTIKARTPFKVTKTNTTPFPQDNIGNPKEKIENNFNVLTSQGIRIEAEKEFAKNLFHPTSPQEQAWRSRKLKNLPHSRDGYWYLSRKNDWVAYLVNIPSPGNYKLWLKDLNDHKHPYGARSLLLSMDGEIIGTFPENSNPQKKIWGWHKLTSLYLSKGQHILILKKAKTTSAAAVIDAIYFTLGEEVPTQ